MDEIKRAVMIIEKQISTEEKVRRKSQREVKESQIFVFLTFMFLKLCKWNKA